MVKKLYKKEPMGNSFINLVQNKACRCSCPCNHNAFERLFLKYSVAGESMTTMSSGHVH